MKTNHGSEVRSARKPRVLVVTRNLPPIIGGMERLVWHIIDEFSKTADVKVVGPEGSGAKLPGNVLSVEVPLKPLFSFLLRAQISALRTARSFRPDIVFAGSGLTAPIVWLSAKLCGARSAVYLHGLDIVAQHFIYRSLWRPFFRKCDLVFVNSRFTQQLATNAGIARDRIRLLHPGVELPDLSRSDEYRNRFRSIHGICETPVMLYVGRITARKGLAYFAEHILPPLVAKLPDARLVVVGDDPVDALISEKGEVTRVKTALCENGMTEHVQFCGKIDDQALSEVYFAADVMVFPLRKTKNNVEGFGMVAIEAAAHGLPTVAFAVDGVPDAVNDPASGRLIEEGDTSAFLDAVVSILSRDDKDAQKESCREFSERFAWRKLGVVLRKCSGLPESTERSDR